MRFRNPRRLPLFLLGCACLLTCGSLKAQVQLGTILGQLRVVRGSAPPDRVLVTLESRAIVFATTYTDGEGRFSFYALPANVYHVTVSDPQYRPVQVNISFNPAITPSFMVQIQLEPLEPTKPDLGTVREPPASGGNPNLVNVADFSQDFPKKAVEEFRKALKAEQQGKVDEAARSYRKAIEIAPNFYPARNQLGVIALQRQDFAAAEVQFEEVIKLNQNDANAYFNLGNVFLLTDKLDDAIRLLEEGLRKQPNSGLGRFLVGSAYRRAGRLEEAERALHDALSFDPALARAHLELVNLYLRQRRNAEAVAELKAFLKSFPTDPMAPQARQVLSRLEGTPQPVSATPQ